MDLHKQAIDEREQVEKNTMHTNGGNSLTQGRSRQMKVLEAKYRRLKCEYYRKSKQNQKLRTKYAKKGRELEDCKASRYVLEQEYFELEHRYKNLETQHKSYINTSKNKFSRDQHAIDNLTITCLTIRRKLKQLQKKEAESATANTMKNKNQKFDHGQDRH